MFLLGQVLRSVVQRGTLQVIDWNGRRHRFGDGRSPVLTMRIHDRDTGRRMLLDPALALGESYMEGTLTVVDDDVYGLLDFLTSNLGWKAEPHWLQRLHRFLRMASRRIAQHNPVRRARRNVAHHYDLSDTLYELFLDGDRQYSCAYFINPDDSLERAQAQKKRHLAAKLLLEPQHKVLDIGSGWGGLGLYLSELTGADVTGITLSEQQHLVSNRRAAEKGLSDRVRFKLQDYRLESGRYDRIVSVGMFEHVGVGFYPAFFNKVRDLLTEDGIAILHSIGRADGPGVTNPWIRKYIFPGGYSPALSEVLPAVEQAGLYVTDIEILRLHYAETLKEWRRRFLANRARIAELYDERFCRMWEFYLAGSEATFRHAGHIVFQIQMAKRQTAVPLTRDYITDFERAHPIPERPTLARTSSAAE